MGDMSYINRSSSVMTTISSLNEKPLFLVHLFQSHLSSTDALKTGAPYEAGSTASFNTIGCYFHSSWQQKAPQPVLNCTLACQIISSSF